MFLKRAWENGVVPQFSWLEFAFSSCLFHSQPEKTQHVFCDSRKAKKNGSTNGEVSSFFWGGTLKFSAATDKESPPFFGGSSTPNQPHRVAHLVSFGSPGPPAQVFADVAWDVPISRPIFRGEATSGAGENRDPDAFT